MYLRFYKQTDENINKCIDELKPYLIGLKQIARQPISLSMNVTLPPETETEKNVQVNLIFRTKEQEDKFYANKKCLAIYQKYCTPIQGAEATARKVGDIAVQH